MHWTGDPCFQIPELTGEQQKYNTYTWPAPLPNEVLPFPGPRLLTGQQGGSCCDRWRRISTRNSCPLDHVGPEDRLWLAWLLWQFHLFPGPVYIQARDKKRTILRRILSQRPSKTSATRDGDIRRTISSLWPRKPDKKHSLTLENKTITGRHLKDMTKKKCHSNRQSKQQYNCLQTRSESHRQHIQQ